MTIRSLRTAILMAGVAVALSGCDTLREAAGVDKSAPDEFAVVTKAPLVIPPDYNLRPPRPGAVPTNQTEPTDAAQMTLFGNDPATVAANMPDSYSPGEKILLANANIQSADPHIREHLASDRKAMLGADDSFTNELLFWQKPKPVDPANPLNSDEEAKRLNQQKSGTGDQAKQPPPKKEEDKGWFDGWFDWL